MRKRFSQRCSTQTREAALPNLNGDTNRSTSRSPVLPSCASRLMSTLEPYAHLRDGEMGVQALLWAEAGFTVVMTGQRHSKGAAPEDQRPTATSSFRVSPCLTLAQDSN